MRLSRSSRRIACVAVVAMWLTAAVPQGAVPVGGGFPLDGLLRLFEVSGAWGAPADTPDQSRGGRVDLGHEVSAAATRANGGVGGPRGKGAGELDPYEPLKAKQQKPQRTPSRAEFDPQTSRRDAGKSSESVDYYDNADGSVTQIVSSGRLNFKDANGKWAAIDTGLVEQAGRGPNQDEVRWESAANDILVSVAGPMTTQPSNGAAAKSWELASVTLPSGEVFGYSLAGATPTSPKVDGSVSRYADVLPGVDVELEATASGLKETLVLASADAGSSWVFPLRLDGLTASIGADGSVLLTDASGAVVAAIPAGQMWDSLFGSRSGEFTTSSAVRYELVEADDGGQALRVSVDEQWLRDPARVFPVYVDPTFSVDTNGDVFVDNLSSGPNQNGDNLPVGTWDGGSSKNRSFVRFDNLGTVSGMRITSAKIRLYHTWSWDCNHHLPVQAYRVTSGWSVSSLTNASYPGPSIGAQEGSLTITDNYPACTNTGANRSIGKWWDMPVNASLVNGWLQGTIPNNGVALVASVTDNYAWKRFTSSNYSSTYAPKLVLTYEENSQPYIYGQYPGFGYTAPTLTPELIVRGLDSDNFPDPLKYQFSVYDVSGQTLQAQSGWSTSPSWVVPANELTWGQTYWWRAQVTDGYKTGTSADYALSTQVRQPPITASLSQNANGVGYEPAIGNFTTSAVDAQVDTVGPELSIVRNYNSSDPRTTGAFGTGWSSILDAKVTEYTNVNNAVERVVITYPGGNEVALGRNPDGSYTMPLGRFVTFDPIAGGYRLVDKDGTRLEFTQALGGGRYAITAMKDARDRALSFTYTGGKVTEVASSPSGRALTLAWSTPAGSSTPRVATVSTNEAVPGDPNSVSTWQYSYTGDALTGVCPPTSATACTAYDYGANSLYPATLLDSRPHTYLRLAEPSGWAARNTALDSLQAVTGTYTDTNLGQAGPLAGSSATAAGFNGSTSQVELTSNGLGLESAYQSVSLWFNTTTPEGVLFSYQQDAIGDGQTAANYTPSIYIGTSGKLYGEFWQGSAETPITSSGTVTDGQWHHVVLTGLGNTQSMYLDGDLVGTLAGQIQFWGAGAASHIYLGAGFIGGSWPDQPWRDSGNNIGHSRYFNGSIAEFAFHDRYVSEQEVGQWYAAGIGASTPLVQVTLPSGRTDRVVAYSTTTGRVSQVTDANGGVWQVGDPAVSGSARTYASAVLGAAPTNYWRLADPAGALAANEVNGQIAEYDAVTLGVTGPFDGVSANPPTAAGFDGATSAVHVADQPVDTTKGFTVTTWVKLDTDGGDDQYIAVMPGDTGESAFKLLYDASDDGWDALMSMRNPDDTNSWQVVEGPNNSVVAGVWTHLTFVGDPDQNKISLYVNGDLAGEYTPTTAFNNHALGLELGYQNSYFLDGTLAEFATFARALSAGEVDEIFDAYQASTGSPELTTTVLDPTGQPATFVYDLTAGRRLLENMDTRGKWTRHGYDVRGFPHTEVDPNGDMTVTGHDVRGNVVSVSNCQDQSQNLCSTIYLDYFPPATGDARNDLVVAVRDGRSSGPDDVTYKTSYEYDTFGDLIKETDPLGRETLTTYSDGTGGIPAGLPLSVSEPDQAPQTMEYAANGDLVAAVDAAGQRMEFTRDGLGRVVEHAEITDAYPAGLVTTYTYDRAGRVLTRTDPGVLDRITGAVHTAMLTLTYDEDGRELTQTVADLTGGDAPRSVARGYNGLGQLAWAEDGLDRRTSYTYNSYGDVATQTTPDGVTTAFAYDSVGHRLTSTVLGWTGNPTDPQPPTDLMVESRAYDPAGRVATVTDAMGWQTKYTYTDNNLIASVVRHDPATSTSFVIESYTYDGAGNPVGSSANNGATTTTVVRDVAGRVTAQTLDPTGVNRRTDYVYDVRDNVVSYRISDGSGGSQQVDRQFDTAGRMIGETLYPGSTQPAPVGRWLLDEESGNTAADSYGNSPATSADKQLARFGGHEGLGASFLQDNDGLVTAGPVLDTTSAYTISAWVNLAGWQPGWGAVVALDGQFNSGAALAYNADADAWTFGRCDPDQGSSCQAGASSSAPTVKDTWTHLVGVFDSAAGVVRLYVDGTLVDEQGGQGALPAAAGPLRMGADLWQGGVDDRLAGTIDDVQVYQRALTDTEVSTLYGSGAATDPVGRWTFDGDVDNNVAEDSVGTHDAVLTQRDVVWSAGHQGGGAAFNRDSDGLLTQGPVVDSSRGYTVAGWVYMYPWQLGSYGAVVAQDGPLNSGFVLGYDASADAWGFSRCDANEGQHCEPAATAASSPATEVWTHLAGVYDPAAGETRLYVDGQLVDTQVGQAELAAFDGPLRISADIWQGQVSDRIAAVIDDVQAYQAVLTDTQVQAIFAGTAPAADAGVLRTSWTVDQRGLVTSQTDADGDVTYYDYDEAGRLAVTTFPPVNTESGDGSAAVFAPVVESAAYNTFGEVVESKDANGNHTFAEFDTAGQLTEVWLPGYTAPGSSTPLTPVRKTFYDDMGRSIESRDPLNNSTYAQYDQLGRLVGVQAADGGNTVVTYSLTGQTLSVSDPTGARTEATYDFLGRPVTQTQVVRQTSQAHTTVFAYHPEGWLASTTAPGRAPSSYTYNSVGQVVRAVDGAGNVALLGYDFAGRQVSTQQQHVSCEPTCAERTTQVAVFDGAGRPVGTQVRDASQAVLSESSAVYGPDSLPVSVTNARGATTTFSYDALGRLTGMVEPVSVSQGITTSYGYDATGGLTRFTDGRGNDFYTTYNPWGLVETQTEPGGAAFTTSYDAAGRPVGVQLPGGVSTTSTYDSMGRLTAMSGSGAEAATATRTFGYDLAGRITSLSGPGGSNALAWDDRGLLTSVTGPSGDSSYSYTADGLLAQRVDAAGTTDYGYDSAGRLDQIANATAGLQLDYLYDTRDQVSQITYGGGNKRLFDYDPLGRLQVDQLLTSADVLIGRITYGWDANSNLTGKTTVGFDGSAVNTYTYDLADRLTSWNDGTSSTETYTYDASGNRISVGSTTFTYNARNQLVSDSAGTTYSYTPRGTLASTTQLGVGTLATESDAFGQVTRAYDTPTSFEEYTYDGLGRVLQDGFAYTGLGNDLAGDPNGTYVRDPAGGLVGVDSLYAWTDLHTDVVGQFTATGTALAESATYSPLGQVLAATSMHGSLGYQSEYTDALTGKVNMHARWYNPKTGQFDSRDTKTVSPVPVSGSANRYAYAAGNPLTRTDPSGHSWIDLLWGVGQGFLDTFNFRAMFNDLKDFIKDPRAAIGGMWSGMQRDANKWKGTVGGIIRRNVPGWVCGLASSAASFWSGLAGGGKVDVCGGVAMAAGWACVLSEVCSVISDCVSALRGDVNGQKECGKQIGGILASALISLVTGGVGAAGAVASRVVNMVTGLLKRFKLRRFRDNGKSNHSNSNNGNSSNNSNSNKNNDNGNGNNKNNKNDKNSKNNKNNGSRNNGGSNSRSSGGGSSAGGGGSSPGRSPQPKRPSNPHADKPPTDPVQPAPKAPEPPEKLDISDADRQRLDDLSQGPGCHACPCHSFDPQTPVLMADGSTKAIKDVKVGDKVRATDPETGESTVQTVTDLFVNLDRELTNVTLTPVREGAAATTGEGRGDRSTRGPTTTLETTHNHPFWDVTTDTWVHAGDLVPGQSVVTGPTGDRQLVVAVDNYIGAAEMRDLTVANIHTYYVIAGEQPVLVHNCNGPTLNLKYKDSWTAEQRAAADAKVAALNSADRLVVTEVGRSGSAADVWRANGRETIPGTDIDHKVDLQLGGADHIDNMWPLDSSVNRSLGAQISAQLKSLGLKPGDVVCSITISARC